MFLYFKGLLGSFNLEEKMKSCRKRIFIVHSLINSLISVNHADALTICKEDQDIMKKNKEKTENYYRVVAYANGGHDIVHDDYDQFKKLISQFIIQI